MRRPEIPEKPKCLDSIEIYYLWLFQYSYRSDKEELLRSLQTNKPICHHCKGSGKVKDYSQRCPVEGYKMADWITCNTCNGSGFMYKQQIVEMYEAELGWYAEDVDIAKNNIRIFNSIQSKLNEEELEWLDRNP